MLDHDQVQAYLGRLGMQEAPGVNREGLDALVYAHQTCVPFETIGVHRGVGAPDLDLETLYAKVVRDGNGGYCFELNKLFEALLCALGFAARPALCRAVRGREGRMPINHRGIVVELDGQLHFADVGFGGPMPAGSLALVPGEAQQVRGETFIVEPAEGGWWCIDRMTQAAADLHDDGVPARRQTELELCEAPVEDIDFAALNLFCSQPGTLFRDSELVNLRTSGGYKGYKDGVLTIRENGSKEVREVSADAADDLLHEQFGIAYR